MNTLTLLLAGAAVTTGIVWPVSTPAKAIHPAPAAFFDDEEGENGEQGHDKAAITPAGPHVKAPLNVNLEILEGTWLRAPNEEWFEAQAETDPGRFEYVDELIDIEGDFEGGYRDNEGEYELRYDEEEDELAYWQHLTADRLTLGRQDYVQFCASCHGFDGAGYGRSAQHLRPPPRNFTKPSFKFSKVPGSLLPSDDALISLVKKGLDGTPMLPWDLSDEQLDDIIQYVKSLSPEDSGWRDIYSEVGGVVTSDEPNPFVGREAEAIRMGEDIYHGKAKCHSCHPGYVTNERFAEIGGANAVPREGLTYPIAKVTENYDVQGHPMKLLPPDFTWHDVRAGISVEELFETIGSGIGGTAMPQWKGSLDDEEIWAMSYYVRDLIETYKGKTADRARFMAGLRQGN